MRIIALLSGITLLAMLGGAASRPTIAAPGGASAARSALAEARREGARARERAAALDREARAATLASERAKFAAAALGARLQQAEAELAGADAEQALLRDQRRELDRWLARERAPIVRLLAGLQTQVRRPPLLTLLQPGSIEDAVHLRAVIAAVGPQIAARTSGLRATLARARAIERESARIAAQRRQLLAELAARRTELATVSAAERLRARRAAGAADREAERALALGEQARDLTTLLRGLQAPLAGIQAPVRTGAATTDGPSPYRLPVAGEIDASAKPATRGVTVLARPGALVVAPAAGRVVFASPFRGYGAIVIIAHADGWTSLVTGLASTRVAVGQDVVAGSPLGQAPTGSPRIGLELRRNGQGVNPLDRLR